MRGAALATVLALVWGEARAVDEPFAVRDGQRVLFIGDSITYAGMYVQYVDAYLRTRFPDQRIDLVNLGLPSETVTGLSEPDHPYPRPDVHERLARALEQVKPNIVVACYGMNDGIYHPFSEARFRQYQAGISRLIERVGASGAQLVLMTPPPFDPRPIGDKVRPLGAEKYSWFAPYAGYDETLARYSEWLLTLREPGRIVVDTRSRILRHLAAARQTEPGYHLADDGVHLNATGHALIALALLKAWHAPADVDIAEIDAGSRAVRSGRAEKLTVENGSISFHWTTRIPMPFDPAWDKRLLELEPIREAVDRHIVRVKDLPAGRYSVMEKERRIATVSAAELERGLDLLSQPALSTNRRAGELFPIIAKRERLTSAAWLSAVGHRRPDTPVGLPLDEAKKQAQALDARIQEQARPLTLELRVEPASK